MAFIINIKLPLCFVRANVKSAFFIKFVTTFQATRRKIPEDSNLRIFYYVMLFIFAFGFMFLNKCHGL
jgi:hypothetical protein